MCKYFSAITMLLMGFFSYGQGMKDYLEYADQNMQKGDYYNAIVHYKKAMDIDSSSVLLNWKIAEAYRRYKDYHQAIYYYDKVYKKEDAKIYPYSIFWLATLQKMVGDYDESRQSWRSAKRIYMRKRRSYEYKKSRQEYKSVVWARSAVKDTLDVDLKPVSDAINSYDSEFAPVFKDSVLIYTSMKGDSADHVGRIYKSGKYKLELFQSKWKDSTFSSSNLIESLNDKNLHSANGTWSSDGSRYYFSKCDDTLVCKIYVAKYKDSVFSDVDVLGEVVNEPGSSNTMPALAYKDDKEYLLFVSNREGGEGGLDIWYSEIKNGQQFKKAYNMGRSVNSPDDEISPRYVSSEDRLYFSSTWYEGFGGMDIFYTYGDFPFKMNPPVNMGIPYNSSFNDTYYYKDTTTAMEFLSSNRTGTKSHKSPNCCNDIFFTKPVPTPPELITENTPEKSITELMERLPVVLYFHNDEPNPKTRDTTTNLNYMTTYRAYKKLEDKYKNEYSKGLKSEEELDAVEDIEEFYIDYVDQGVADLELFTNLLIKELDKGIKVKINVKGFASPLAKTDYNVHLTKRRIASLVNYFEEYEGGVFKPYLKGNAENGGKLLVKGVPFGEYRADKITSDNFHDQRNSVYSRAAMIERKIEIQSVELIRDSIVAEVETKENVYDFGYITEDEIVEHEFTIENKGNKDLELLEMEIPCKCVTVDIDKAILAPGEKVMLKVQFDPKGYQGLQYRDIKVITDGIPEVITFTVTADIIDENDK